MEKLSPDKCLELLALHRVGRIVYRDDEGPIALPVNYALAGSDIVFRIEESAKKAAMSQPGVGFEVDFVDRDMRSGWSVLVRGTAEEIPLEQVPAALQIMPNGPPQPWATGVHNVWVRVVRRRFTGRQLGEQEDPNVI